MDPKELIKCINASCKKSISSAFNLSLCSHNHNFIHFVIDGTYFAVNKHELVKVLKWFDDFWLFLEIKFNLPKKRVKRNKEIQIQISLSVFHGVESDDKKQQLFRAEWDDYDNLDEKHAQPHWHITANQAIDNTFEKYLDNDFEESDFLITGNKKQKILDVSELHFAMSGNWQNNEKHVHEIENEQQVVNWLQGMLAHVRIELESL